MAERDGALIGVAMAGPPETREPGRACISTCCMSLRPITDPVPATPSWMLSSAPHQSAALWVADPNPRAQAFYVKNGFVPDGTVQVEDGVRGDPHGSDLRRSPA